MPTYFITSWSEFVIVFLNRYYPMHNQSIPSSAGRTLLEKSKTIQEFISTMPPPCNRKSAVVSNCIKNLIILPKFFLNLCIWEFMGKMKMKYGSS